MWEMLKPINTPLNIVDFSESMKLESHFDMDMIEEWETRLKNDHANQQEPK